MQVITSTEMAALDANCEYYGLARMQLMENAGASLANIIKQKFPQDTPVTIFAGKGSNGGDAFVAARHLTGYNVQVFLLGRGDEIKTAGARWNFSILKKAGTPIIEITDSTQIPELDNDCVIIDAIFGTGIKGRLRPLESTAIDRINSCASEVVSVDVPSGLDPDTGDFKKAVRSNITITFHNPEVFCEGCEGEILGKGGSFIPQEKIDHLVSLLPPETEAPATKPPSEEETPSEETQGSPGFGIITAFLGLFLVMFYLAKRR
ncbi:MAG: NAD(P)H-hydrate epimerase [Candidatus Argoarchaeum ethanivorans]|uniref:NAD(P)H-hydrate epimerase n=1 Tax=Candidatus Argoarchaeum ethanivorans TaxID=2608793 RepID=A0A811TB76_9EURY|nr:MAG: NAD(P)H-hydrate epimerase [Candidatus Argoarchaeum ethanivorans]